jgi:homoserine O-acetyltransferase
MKTIITLCLFLFSSLAHCFAQPASPGLLTSIGDFKIESGAVIRNCTLGYRVHGRLNAKRNNAVVFCTWFGGNAAGVEVMKPWLAIDTSKYCLIIIDALGDGVSASPSNSKLQHGADFPRFTIRDMVNSQYALLTQKLNIKHVRAVMGISMGGIQTFEWAVSHPNFMDVLIPIVGSPQPTSYDLMLYQTIAHLIDNDPGYQHGRYTNNPNISGASMVFDLFLTTPTNRVKTVLRETIPHWVANAQTQSAGHDWNDTFYQMSAIIGHDISKSFHSSLPEAAAHIKARMLIITSLQDMVVNPAPAIAFSKLLPAPLVELNDERGHSAPDFNNPQMRDAIVEALAKW